MNPPKSALEIKPGPKKGQKRRIAAWTLYDWANSAFTTIVVTFVYSTYFSQSFAPDKDTGTDWWAWAVRMRAVPCWLGYGPGL